MPGSHAKALSEIRTLQSREVQSIDVGCFQISLLHHPAAFTSLDEVLDATSNATYAGRLLASLYTRMGGWSEAIAAYHSAQPERGAAYRTRVFAAWAAKDPSGTMLRGSRTEQDSVTVFSTYAPAVKIWSPGDTRTSGGLPWVISPRTFPLSPLGRWEKLTGDLPARSLFGAYSHTSFQAVHGA